MLYNLLYLDSVPLVSPVAGDAGYDLPLYGDIVIQPGQITPVYVGLAVEIPTGHVGIVFGRSGNAFKHKLLVIHNGVIDSSFRGEIGVLLSNLGDKPVSISHGSMIAQLVLFPVYTEQAQETEVLSDSSRGNEGFGSTGLAGLILDKLSE